MFYGGFFSSWNLLVHIHYRQNLLIKIKISLMRLLKFFARPTPQVIKTKHQKYWFWLLSRGHHFFHSASLVFYYEIVTFSLVQIVTFSCDSGQSLKSQPWCVWTNFVRILTCGQTDLKTGPTPQNTRTTGLTQLNSH